MDWQVKPLLSDTYSPYGCWFESWLLHVQASGVNHSHLWTRPDQWARSKGSTMHCFHSWLHCLTICFERRENLPPTICSANACNHGARPDRIQELRVLQGHVKGPSMRQAGSHMLPPGHISKKVDQKWRSQNSYQHSERRRECPKWQLPPTA